VTTTFVKIHERKYYVKFLVVYNSTVVLL